MQRDKLSIFLALQTSKQSKSEDPQYQHRNQLSPGYETRVWTANEVNTPCEEQNDQDIPNKCGKRQKNVYH